MSLWRRGTRTALAVVLGLVGVVIASSSTHADAGSREVGPSIVADMAVLRDGGPAPHAGPRLRSLADGMAAVDSGDLSQLRLVGTNLGHFDSSLVILPSETGGLVCYALLGGADTNPGLTYCYQPLIDSIPAPLADQRFHASALETNRSDGLRTQIFGIAFDSVRELRLQVQGEWKNLPVRRNSFYVDLPGVPYSDVGIIEATLSDGTVRIHDVQQGG